MPSKNEHAPGPTGRVSPSYSEHSSAVTGLPLGYQMLLLAEQPSATEIGRPLPPETLDGGLVEHELDHVLIGRWNGSAVPDPSEVAETRWVDRHDLLNELEAQPNRYTEWFRQVVQHACRHEGSLAA